MSRLIDVMHLGNDRVIGAYEQDGLIVDPGPGSCVDTLLDALHGAEPRALLLTHVHLDHAGATGLLVRRFPALTVYVHERGAPHLVDPTKLVRSARQLYGEDMDRLWGEFAPVPEERIRALAGGETVEGHRVAYTPGHASHHVCYLDEATGTAYTGDVTGVRIPPVEHVVAPTPPPDIDLESWDRSLSLIDEWTPSALCLTHFGRIDAVEAHMLRMREALVRTAERSRSHGEEAFVGGLEQEVLEAADGDHELFERFVQAAPPRQLWLGLERYWRKRSEREAVPAP